MPHSLSVDHTLDGTGASRTLFAECSLGKDTRAMLRLIFLTGLLAGVVIAARGLVFPMEDAVGPTATCLALCALAVFYQVVRPAPNFVLCLRALAVLVGFSTVYSIFMYALATTAHPLGDDLLARSDAALGLSAATVVDWVNARPRVELGMRLVYFSLIPQTILAIVWLGLTNRRYNLDKFLLRFILGALITAIGFYLLPAIGTCQSYDLPVPHYYQPIIDHLEVLRSGVRTLVSWRGAEGLITFPSFHAIWAVLQAAAFYGCRRFFVPIALLNVAVVVSTVTTGMHYFTDVLAGLAISAVVIFATRDKKEPPSMV